MDGDYDKRDPSELEGKEIEHRLERAESCNEFLINRLRLRSAFDE